MATNVQKSSVAISTTDKSGSVLWADTVATWADASYLWVTQGKIPSNVSKGTSTISNVQKS